MTRASSDERATTTPAERPIGVFDSGIGGLTVMHSLMERLPRESLIYFGDTARVDFHAYYHMNIATEPRLARFKQRVGQAMATFA